jgi:beta-phosphoglucomutase-like phosphatase (HAD superfamily)
MRDLRAVIFDMDGVIVDSERHHERAFREVVHELGYEGLGGLNFADYVGRSDFELWVDFIARNKPAQSLEELLARKRQRVINVIRETRPIFKGLFSLVEKAALRYPLAIASGSEHAVIQAVLSLEGLHRFFPVLVSASDVKRGKPAPDIFLHAARLLEVEPKDCVVIEDSKPGVRAGLAAGMKVVAITNTHSADALRAATHVVDSYEAIERLLLQG